MWYETDKKELVLGQMLCMEGVEKTAKLGKCHEMGGNQEWRHKSDVSIHYLLYSYEIYLQTLSSTKKLPAYI